MRFNMKHLLFSLLLISMLITNATAQSDEYYNISRARYSNKLVEGMEFTWIISKYNIELNDSFTNQEGTTEYTETYTQISETTISGEVTTVTDEYTVTISEDSSGLDLPDIQAGVTITVTLLQDLSNLTNNYFGSSGDDYYDYDDYQAYLGEFFEFSYSGATEEQMKDFIPIELLIGPNTLEFENGTEMNFYEFQVEQFDKNREEYEESGIYQDYQITDGVLIQKNNYSDTENDFSNYIEFRTDVDTGVLLYIYAQSHDQFGDFEIEIKLSESKGIEIDNLVANDDPTLSVPISAIFVYTLILIPIILKRIRKK